MYGHFVLQLGDKKMIAEYLKSSAKESAGGDIHDRIPIVGAFFPGAAMTLQSISRAMVRVISFDTAIYAEVAGNKGASLQALSIVLFSALAAGVSTYFAAGFEGSDVIVSQIFLALVGWVLWVSITYFVGTQIFRKRAHEGDWKSLARALGFAQSAGVLRVLAVIPGLGVALTLVVLVWIFIASVFAIRGALGFDSYWRAIGVMAIALVPFVPVMAFLNLLIVGS